MAFPKLKISDDDGNVADVTSNRLDVNTSHPSGLGTIDSLGRFTVPSTTAAISVTTSTTVADAKEIIIQASDVNDQDILVGDSGTAHATNGIVLAPGDTLILPIADLSDLYWDTSASGTQRAFVTIIK